MSVPATQTGEAAGVNAIACTIGSSTGTAVVAAVITSQSASQGLPTDAAFTAGFWVCGGVAVLAVVAPLALPSARHRRAQALAAGIDDLPPARIEVHLPHPHLATVSGTSTNRIRVGRADMQ